MPVFTTLAALGAFGATAAVGAGTTLTGVLTTGAIIGAAEASLVGAGIGIKGAVEASQASKEAARAARKEGEIAADIERGKTERIRSTAAAAGGTSGLTGASPLLFDIQSAFESLKETNAILTGAGSRARALRQEGKAALASGLGSGIAGIGSSLTNLGLLTRDA